MNKETIAAYVISAAAGLVILFAAATAFAASLGTSADATYKLHANGTGICSAQFIKNVDEGSLFLTAAHCVDMGPKTQYSIHIQNKGLSVGPKDTQQLEVLNEMVLYLRVLRADPKGDVALLVTRDKTAGTNLGDPIDLATVDEANSVKFGEDVVVLGFPAAEEKTITKGQFTGKINGVLDMQFNYQTNVPVAGGNSGGGLYAKFGDTDDGWKLIGTTSAARNDNSIMTYYAVAEAIKEVTAGFMQDKRQPTPKAPSSGSMDER